MERQADQATKQTDADIGNAQEDLIDEGGYDEDVKK